MSPVYNGDDTHERFEYRIYVVIIYSALHRTRRL